MEARRTHMLRSRDHTRSRASKLGMRDDQRTDERATHRVGRRPVGRVVLARASASRSAAAPGGTRADSAPAPRYRPISPRDGDPRSASRQTRARRPRPDVAMLRVNRPAPARASRRCRRCRTRGRPLRGNSGWRRSRRPAAPSASALPARPPRARRRRSREFSQNEALEIVGLRNAEQDRMIASLHPLLDDRDVGLRIDRGVVDDLGERRLVDVIRAAARDRASRRD